jgi:hypothetical protein
MKSPLSRVELIAKPLLTMEEAAVVVRKSVDATRRFVEAHCAAEPTLIDRSRRYRMIRTTPLLRVLDETAEGIVEKATLAETVRRHGERLDDHAQTLRDHDRRLRSVEARGALRTPAEPHGGPGKPVRAPGL